MKNSVANWSSPFPNPLLLCHTRKRFKFNDNDDGRKIINKQRMCALLKISLNFQKAKIKNGIKSSQTNQPAAELYVNGPLNNLVHKKKLASKFKI